ncbi:MAG: hypothetical protein ABR865_06430 [Terracidiphilus sp.]|jgi:hypothetical protein
MTSPKNSPPTPAAPRFLLVMTATVAPPANAQVKRSSPQVRLEDYKRALRFWLHYPHAAAERILFLENSGADLSELRAIAETKNPQRREVEFLSLPVHEIPPGTNYGYTEMQMLDDGLALSKIRHDTTHMIKVTGRLTFPALGKALDRIANSRSVPLELMIDCRRLGLFRRGYDARVQLFVCSHAFYDRVLRNSNREMNSTDVRLLEHLIYRKVIPFKGRPGCYLRFPCNIDPVGHFGFKDRRYDSPRTAVSRGTRALLRVIAPNYWF